MRAWDFIQRLLALGVFVLATGSAVAEEYPIKPIPGLELTRGDDVLINGPQGHAIAFKFQDGRICLYGDGSSFSYWSHDGGRTWSPGPEGPLEETAIDFGNGEILGIKRGLAPQGDGKLTVKYRHSTDNWATVQSTLGVADIPLASGMASDTGGFIDSMLVHHGIVELTNGTLLATVYGCYKGDRVLSAAYPPNLHSIKRRTVVISSTDRGKTWGNPVTVGYDTMLGIERVTPIVRTTIVPAITQEGFTEPDLTVAPNGDVICVMRSGGAVGAGVIKTFPTPLYASRSSDNGNTWTPPEPIADRGCNPSLVTLQNGVIVCCYSRPGAWLIFSDDNGKTWKGETQFAPNNNYIYMVDGGPDTVLTFREGSGSSVIATYFTIRKL